MKKYCGILILLIAMVVNVVETIYFGCNNTALTPAETVWDGICAVGMWMGVFFMAFDWADYFWSNVKVNVGTEQD